MRYHVLATDFDGTLAHDGVVAPDVQAAMRRLRGSGRKLLLVTGRELDDLQRVFPELTLFDRVVAENGALLYDPATRTTRLLAERPPEVFVETLRTKGVSPMSVGQVIVATWQPHAATVLEVIRSLGLELQVIFNKDAVMVLPSGCNKALGLAAALEELGLSPHNTVAVGDAENDHAFLAACECAVAVANALPMLKERADFVTAGARGDGVRELCDGLVDDDLASRTKGLPRHAIPVGVRVDERSEVPVTLDAYGPAFMLAGTSGGGKSTLATAFLEELAARGYQHCVIDPEGDYNDVLPDATVIGSAEQPPSIDAVVDLLRKPRGPNVVVNLLGLSLPDRPPFFDALLPRLQELRATTGRPHWLVVDETHHLMPKDWHPATVTVPQQLDNVLFITVHPEHVSTAVLQALDMVITLGEDPLGTMAEVTRTVGEPSPAGTVGRLPKGEALAYWRSRPGAAPVHFRINPPRAERRRHIRKYATGDLGPERSFYFRGPTGKLNLRAQNLQLFLQVADGVDDETWLHHLRQGDYSQWFREGIKDDQLAAEAAAIEKGAGRAGSRIDAAATRADIRTVVERRYTAPA